ncbi:hypothetical protein [Verrucomicrobium spinosum]|nr:hypothetical protein [Verrucomicrobium spinosum]
MAGVGFVFGQLSGMSIGPAQVEFTVEDVPSYYARIIGLGGMFLQ